MVKINFKSTPPISSRRESAEAKNHKETLLEEKSTEAAETIKSPPDSTSTGSPSEDIEKVQEAAVESVREETEIPQEEEKVGFKTEQIAEEESYITPYATPWKKIITILGIIAVLVVATIFIIFQLREKKGEEQITQVTEKEQIEKEEITTAEATKTPDLIPIYQQNVTTNKFISNQLNGLIAKKPESADFVLIVMSPSEIHFTVLTDSRDQIAQTNIDFKKAFPNFGFRVVSIQPRIIDGKERLYADISAKYREHAVECSRDKTPRCYSKD